MKGVISVGFGAWAMWGGILLRGETGASPQPLSLKGYSSTPSDKSLRKMLAVINVGQMIGHWSEARFVHAMMIVGGIVLMVVSVLMLVTGSAFTI